MTATRTAWNEEKNFMKGDIVLKKNLNRGGIVPSGLPG
jgi:hypothetical protein